MSCRSCFEGEPQEVWARIGQLQLLERLVDESHYGVSLEGCRCGQLFVKVFCESIDWVHGEDPQAWVLAPVTADEADQLRKHHNPTALSPRKWLDRYFPSDANKAEACWREGPILLMPHD